MNPIDVAEKAVIFSSEEPVSKVESALLSKKLDSAIVINGEYRGLLWVRDFGKKKVPEPEKTEIGKFVRPIKPFSPETPLDDLLTAIVINDWPALPLRHDEEYYILTKIGMLQLVKKEVGDKKVDEIMAVPFSVEVSESITTTQSILRDTGVSRLVVVDRDGRFVGIIDILDLLKANIQKKRAKLGERAGESLDLDKVSISGFVQKNVPTLKLGDNLKQAIEKMVKFKLPACVVLEGERPVGILTPKPILRLAIKKLAGVWVQLSGIQDLDPFLKAVLDEQITHAVQKWSKFLPVQQLHAHFDRYEKEGKRQKWSIKAKLITEKGIFYADDHDWDITKAMRWVLNKFEKELLKLKGKEELRGRGP
ncbi:MAG: hypothetical protein DRP12_01455 [Candidatus Aenigmatarchaeota archaeon]|nr:MAG: hypothetical protein DRP12_01455 [Candidatus Aenigmarchaeota archaeon]